MTDRACTSNFSLFVVCGIRDRVGIHFSLLFCTSMWALKCDGFHRNLFVDGFSFGKCFELLMSYIFFFEAMLHSVMCVSFF